MRVNHYNRVFDWVEVLNTEKENGLDDCSYEMSSLRAGLRNHLLGGSGSSHKGSSRKEFPRQKWRQVRSQHPGDGPGVQVAERLGRVTCLHWIHIPRTSRGWGGTCQVLLQLCGLGSYWHDCLQRVQRSTEQTWGHLPPSFIPTFSGQSHPSNGKSVWGNGCKEA